ncbi:MAG: MBOAT family O-acyltransferase, partial [Candidatus Thermoplasmatota archaeon]
RDYLYISLGGSRKGQRRLYIALMTTMALGGLWHGASWNFVLWGVVHGLILIGHRLLVAQPFVQEAFERKRLRAPLVITGWFITQVLVFLTWLIFRVEDTKMLIEAISGFLFLHGEFDVAAAREVLPEVQHLTTALVVVFIVMHGISGRLGRLRDRLSEGSPVLWGVFAGISIVAMLYLRPSESSEFIYFRF